MPGGPTLLRMESLDSADPRTVGGYPLFARLGAGGMGQVYLARTPAGRALALKTVRSEFGLDPGFGERFAREIRHADRVRSPWTVAVVDFSPEGSRPQWLATEFVAAPSLAEWVAAHGPLPEAAVTALAAELCQALDAVHQAGLAHRDVKPSNVLLARQRPQLIDFGIARAAEDSRHTSTGGVIGSPGFMAPEQATAGASAEPGDLFALAAVLVYAATGHGPFSKPGESTSTPALLYRVVHEEPDLSGLPDSVAPLVRACLTKDPQTRPTAREALGLLPGQDRQDWAATTPAGLAQDVADREAETRAALADPAPVLGPSPYAPTSPAAGQRSGPSSGPQAAPQSAPHLAPHVAPRVAPQAAPRTGPPAGPLTGPGRPPLAQGPHGMRPGPGNAGNTARPYSPAPVRPAPSGARWGPAAASHQAPPQGPHQQQPQGPMRPQPVRPLPPIRKPSPARWIAPIAVGIVVLLAVIGALTNRHPDKGDSGSTGTSSSGSSADALPASWVGTWVGTGPGNPSGSGAGQPRTDRFTVTLTLVAGNRGSVVGQQVSDVDEVGTGRNLGCTEALLLAEVHPGYLVFEAAESHPTDASVTGQCPVHNRYQVTQTGASTLRLDSGGATGSPRTFAKQE